MVQGDETEAEQYWAEYAGCDGEDSGTNGRRRDTTTEDREAQDQGASSTAEDVSPNDSSYC